MGVITVLSLDKEGDVTYINTPKGYIKISLDNTLTAFIDASKNKEVFFRTKEVFKKWISKNV